MSWLENVKVARGEGSFPKAMEILDLEALTEILGLTKNPRRSSKKVVLPFQNLNHFAYS